MMKKIVVLALVFGFSMTSLLNAQNQQTQKEQFEKNYQSLKSLVKTQDFNFVGEVVFDGSTREKLDNKTNTISINDSEIAGKMISLKSVGKTIDVNGSIENYKAIFDDDAQYIFMEFNAKSATQSLDFTIEIKPNGKATLTVLSVNDDSITWVGYLKN